MDIKKIIRLFLVFYLMIFSLCFINGIDGSKDLIASIAQIPGMADTPDKGLFVDLVKAIDEAYTEGTIKIIIAPFPRSVDNVLKGKADFHMPINVNPLVPVSKQPFGYVSERLGKMVNVLYSHVDKPITKKLIDRALVAKGKFPYKIEAGQGAETTFGFPIIPTANLEQSLRKVDAKRIDAFLWAQEEADLMIKDLKFKSIYRAELIALDDALLIQKGAAGNKVDRILSKAIKKLRASGKLQKLYSKIHKPYVDWQPSQMGW
jgi:polar amino acid transport system substrate-binding protein